jgi:deoxycytidine triphosphate deaminase
MSVLQIKGRTTTSQTDFDAFSLSSNSCIFTTASDSNVEEFSIELSLGEGWNDNYSEHDKNLRRIDENITLNRHGSIVVEVQEEIRVPHNRYGIVLPTGSLFLSRGILIASAKVEPAFCGKLKLRLFNTTQQRIVLTKGEKLGSLIFFSTESTKIHNVTYRKSEISVSPVSHWTETKKWFSANKTVWIGWIITIITSSLFSFVLTYTVYYKPMLDVQNRTEQVTNQSSKNEIKQEKQQ